VAGAAYGDALGARYEGLYWAPTPQGVRFGRGVLVWRRPGWWTDDTDMTLGILRAATELSEPGSSQHGLASPTGLEGILRQWITWHRRSNPLDAGLNTYRVVRAIADLDNLTIEHALGVSRRQLRHPRRGGGNGAVMRTAPVALAYPGDSRAAFQAAMQVAELTHPAQRATQAAGLWTVLCERAIHTGTLHLAAALECVEEDPFWTERLLRPRSPGRNGPRGWAPTTVADAAWCVHTALDQVRDPAAALDHGVRLAVSSSGDPDTTAAVAGALLGALAGSPCVPHPATDRIHGGRWTGREHTLHDIEQLAETVAGRAFGT
jgi:ADP-ribosylglycohydrolase